MVEVAPNSCWIWLKGTRNGYGVFQQDGKVVYAHRAAWEAQHGSRPTKPRMELHHLCGDTHCYRPSHLILVGCWAHMFLHNHISIRRAMQTHCFRGHSLADAYIDRGLRRCRTCCKQARPRWRKRRK